MSLCLIHLYICCKYIFFSLLTEDIEEGCAVRKFLGSWHACCILLKAGMAMENVCVQQYEDMAVWFRISSTYNFGLYLFSSIKLSKDK